MEEISVTYKQLFNHLFARSYLCQAVRTETG